jgi:hypothetical protein
MDKHSDILENETDETEFQPEAEADEVENESDENEAAEESSGEKSSAKKPTETKQGKDDSLYLDFNKPLLPTEKVKARIQAETRQRFEDQEKIKKLNDELIELRKKQHEAQKPQAVQKPDPVLAYENREEYDKQTHAFYQSQQQLQTWEQDRARIESMARQREIEEVQAIQNSFLENAARKGITKEQAEQTAATVATHLQQMQLGQQDQVKAQQLMRLVLKNENGSQLLDALSRKPEELRNLMRLDLVEAGYQLGEISRQFKTQFQSKTPPPDEPIRNSNVSKSSAILRGATFE